MGRNLDSKSSGFTLIELLVVVAIIGILAAIAVPQYTSYKRQAADKDAHSNLRNAATAMEAYYGSNSNSYDGATLDVLTGSFGYRQSASVDVSVASTSTVYTLTASASGGSGYFTLSAEVGKIVGP